MLRILVLISYMGIYSSVTGQELVRYAAAEGIQSPFFLTPSSYQKFDNVVLPPGYRMRRVGSALTLAGTALFVGGVIMVYEAQNAYPNSTVYYAYDPNLYWGSMLILGGIGMAVPGIIFWVRGAKKYNRYLEYLQGSVNLSGTGLAVRLKF